MLEYDILILETNMARDIATLLNPSSIAIIGATPIKEKIGAILLQNITESNYKGDVFLVNPSHTQIDTYICYRSVLELPKIVDLAVIAILPNAVVQAVQECAQKGIKNIVVITAGFKEIGKEGEVLENQIIDLAQKNNLNILGPNCLGFVNNTAFLNVTFAEPVKQTGNIRFVAQSGAIAASFFDYCNAAGLGFSEFITLGNKAVINENDVLEYFLTHDGSPKPIGLYLESITNGQEFLQLATKLSKKQPLFIIKPGKTPEAKKAMQSHTGSIAGEDAVLNAALSQAGIIRCNSLEDFFDLTKSLTWATIPEGPKVAIVSNAGGPAVISADTVIEKGLELADITIETRKKLIEKLPRSASIINPIDVLGDALADRIGEAIDIILQTAVLDALVVIITPQLMTQIEKTAQVIGQMQKKTTKPIFCAFIGGSKIAEGEKILDALHIPSFRFPERAIKSIGMMWQWKKWQKELLETPSSAVTEHKTFDKTKQIIQQAITNNQKILDNITANILLEEAHIPVPKTQPVKNLEESKQIAKDMYPITLKITGPNLLHKTDVHGVILHIADEKQLQTAWDELQKNILSLPQDVQKDITIYVQKEITGIEVLAGIKEDPTFGYCLLFGAGGSFVELIEDRNICLLPLDKSCVEKLIKKSKIYTLLKGYRGEHAFAIDQLISTILSLAEIVEEVPHIEEIEINPVIVTKTEALAIDAKVVL